MYTHYVKDQIDDEYAIGGSKNECDTFVENNKVRYPQLKVYKSTGINSLNTIKQNISHIKSLKELL